MEGSSLVINSAIKIHLLHSMTPHTPSLLSVAPGGLHQASGQGDAGTGAGLHRPHRGLRVCQPAAAAAGNAAHVEKEQTHRW